MTVARVLLSCRIEPFRRGGDRRRGAAA